MASTARTRGTGHTTTPARRVTRRPAVALRTGWLAAGALALAGCSLAGQAPADEEAEGASSGGAGGTVTLVTHDSFGLDEALLDTFTEQTGLRVDVVQPGDGGTLVNQLVLTKDSPLGDAVYGIDNSFASRAIEEGVLQPYASPALPEGAEQYAVDDEDHLTPIDVGDVCVNVDHAWFAERGLAEPTTLEDLADPAYRDLLVVSNPATSSPGLAFLLATVGAFGEDGWAEYWASLRDNGVKVVEGWSDAYYVDFSGSSGEGPRPLVVSYASSPPAEVTEGADTAPTGALLDTCFRQVEYAGVLAGADEVEGAQQLVDFLLSPEVQAAIPESMYVYPVDASVPLPESWEQFGPLAEDPFTVAPQDIDAHRDEWIRTWTDTVIG